MANTKKNNVNIMTVFGLKGEHLIEPLLNVYIAAPWVRKDAALTALEECEAAGLNVTSRWIKYHPDTVSDDILCEQAQNDIDDVCDADAMIFLPLQKSEGKATELGFAYTRGINIYLVGWPEDYQNVFYHLPAITRVDSVSAAIEQIKDDLG